LNKPCNFVKFDRNKNIGSDLWGRKVKTYITAQKQ
jgi:hypothetical protein